MLKTKDGYAKVIGTSYLGSSDYLLLSNGDSKAISSLSVNYATSAGNADTLDKVHLNGIFTAFLANGNATRLVIGGVTKDLTIPYASLSPFLCKNSTFNSTGLAGLQYYDGDMSNTTNNNSWSVPSSGWHLILHLPLSVSGYFTELSFPVNDVNGLAWRLRRSNSYYGWYRILDSNNYSSYVKKIGTSTVGSSSIPIYLNAGTPTLCSTTLGVSITGNAATATTLKTTRTLWGLSFNGTADVNGTIYINNNNSSNGAIRLNNNVNSNARISAIDSQVIFNTDAAIRFGGTSWDWNVWAGLKYTHSNKTIYLGIADNSIFNANSVLSGGSLRFPGISNVYAPTFNGSLSGNASTATNADKIDGYHAYNLFRDLGWWNSSETHNANDISGNGAVFAYSTHSNVPVTGVLTTFSGKYDSYNWQMSKAYTNRALYIRQRNGDNGTWSDWVRLLDENDLVWDNIAGKPSSFTPSSHTHSWDSITGKPISFTPSAHTHDGRYLKLTGGIMQLGEGLKFHADDNYFGTDLDARIISLLDGNDKICDGGLIIDERGTLNGKEYVTELLRIRHSEFKWKGSNILHSGNTYVSNNKGYINSTEITLVNNADTVDGVHVKWNGYLESTSHLVAWESDGSALRDINPSNVSVGNSDKLDGLDSTKFLRQVVVPNNTENDFNTFSNMTLTGRVDPTTGASLKNAPWSGSGPGGGYGVLTYLFNGSAYGTQMAWEYGTNRIYIRNRHWGGSGVGSVWRTSWDKLALTSDIPTSLKNPYSLTLLANGTTLATYDGSVSKIVNLTYDNVGAAAKNHTHNSLEPWASYITGDSHATALKSIFDKNKTSIPRNKFISMLSSAYGNGTYYMGYFLLGYENNPYGGFFVAHYDTAYYVGILNGTFSLHRLAYSTDIPNSLKNPHALTISLNGTSLGSYDGSAAKNINITPGSIGAATSGHNHDGRYLALSGGTMTGTIRFNNLINIGSAIVLDYKYSAGGFARDIVSMKNSVYGDANLGALSILCYPDSTSNGFLYIYLGTDKYDGPNNLRIYKDKVTFGNNILIDAGNIGSLSVAYASKAGSVAWGSITGKPNTFTPSAHDHNYVLDIANNSHTTFAYSKPGLSKDSITWLAVWNGYEMRAMNKDQVALSGHTHDDRYLKLTGGTMTGNIRYKGTKETYDMIRFVDNNVDVYGNGICIGGGGLTIIGGGDSASSILSKYTNGGEERMIIANDNAIDFFSNMNNGWDSRKAGSFDISGYWNGAGFKKNNSNDNYVLTGGGGHKAESSLNVANADKVDGYHASNLVKFYLSPMASNASADSAKSWFINTMPSASGAIVYNVPGAEKTIIAGKSSGAHGHMLQLNYDDNYLRMLRYRGGSWKSTDWEKISAGYADSAGSVAWSNITNRPSSLKNPYSLNIFGVTYDGSATKTVTTSTFISLLSEGTSTVTDGTMFITSWASDSGFSDTNAVNVPYKRKASCLWNYIDSKISSKYLPLAGGTMNGNARIGHGSGNLYIGNSGNDGWIYTQDIASLKGTGKWSIRESGAAHFGLIHIASKTDSSFNSSVIECNSTINLNYFSSLNVSLCNGGGTVQIGPYTTGDTGNNKLFVNGSEFIDGASNVRNHVFADGFRHRSHNSNDSVLLAGGGYSQGVPVRYWAIYYMYIGNSSTDVTYTKRSGNYDFITSKEWDSEGVVLLNISFPSGYNKNNTLIFGSGDHRTSSSWKTPVYVTITTSPQFGWESKIRVMMSDDASLNTGFANIYFMCMG